MAFLREAEHWRTWRPPPPSRPCTHEAPLMRRRKTSRSRPCILCTRTSRISRAQDLCTAGTTHRVKLHPSSPVPRRRARSAPASRRAALLERRAPDSRLCGRVPRGDGRVGHGRGAAAPAVDGGRDPRRAAAARLVAPRGGQRRRPRPYFAGRAWRSQWEHPAVQFFRALHRVLVPPAAVEVRDGTAGARCCCSLGLCS